MLLLIGQQVIFRTGAEDVSTQLKGVLVLTQSMCKKPLWPHRLSGVTSSSHSTTFRKAAFSEFFTTVSSWAENQGWLANLTWLATGFPPFPGNVSSGNTPSQTHIFCNCSANPCTQTWISSLCCMDRNPGLSLEKICNRKAEKESSNPGCLSTSVEPDGLRSVCLSRAGSERIFGPWLASRTKLEMHQCKHCISKPHHSMQNFFRYCTSCLNLPSSL